MSTTDADDTSDTSSDPFPDRDQCRAAASHGDRCRNAVATAGLCAEHLRDPDVSPQSWPDVTEDKAGEPRGSPAGGTET